MNTDKEVRCFHADSIQFTRTQSMWCPDCGSARLETKEGKGRWQRPKMSDKRRKAAEAASVKSAVKQKRAPKAGVAVVVPVAKKTRVAKKAAPSAPKYTAKQIKEATAILAQSTLAKKPRKKIAKKQKQKQVVPAVTQQEIQQVFGDEDAAGNTGAEQAIQ